MASRAVFTLEEVLDELDNDEEMSDGSEDEFDGYLEESERIDEDELEEETSSKSPERSVADGAGDDDMNGAGDVDMNGAGDDMEVDVPSIAASDPPGTIPTYTLQPGLVSSQADKSPLAYFSRFVTQSMLEEIVEQTKLYSEQYRNSNTISSKSRVRRWLKEEPTVPEFLHFLAEILVMGIIKYPSIESHWNTSWPYVTDTFRKVRFYKNQKKKFIPSIM